MEKLIVLFSEENFKRLALIDKNFYNNSSISILAFTIEIRTFLQNLNIPYIINESYLDEETAKELDDIAFFMSKKWYNNYFKFMGLSFGSIHQKDFFFFFAVNLRHMEIFISIINDINPVQIITFDDKDINVQYINNMLDFICSVKNLKLEVISQKNNLIKKANLKKHSDFKSNIIQKLGNSRLYKIILKIFLNLTLKLKTVNYKKNKKFVLYHGYRYQNLNLSKNQNIKIIFLADKIEIFKDWQNRLFVSKLISKHYFYLFQSKDITKKARYLFNETLKRWNKTIEDPSFQEFFIYKGYNFWPVFKMYLEKSFYSKFKNDVIDFLISYKILTTLKVDLVMFEHDLRPRSRILSYLTLKLGIPSISIQHGITGHFFAFVPSFCTKIAVWGKISRDYLNIEVTLPNQLAIVGSDRFDDYINLKKNVRAIKEINKKVRKLFKIPEEKKLIVFASNFNHFYKNSSSRDLNHYELEKMIKDLYYSIKDSPELFLIVKLHPGETHTELYHKIKEMVGLNNIAITQNYNIKNLIISCDCFISGFSTTIIESMLAEKPTIVISYRKSCETIPIRPYDIIDIVSNFNDLKQSIMNALFKPFNPNIYNKFLQDYLFKLDGLSTNRILNLIDNLIANN